MVETTTISIKIPTTLDDLLERVSKKEDRSKSSIVRLALQEYLEEFDDFEDLKLDDFTFNTWFKDACEIVPFEKISKNNKAISPIDLNTF